MTNNDWDVFSLLSLTVEEQMSFDAFKKKIDMKVAQSLPDVSEAEISRIEEIYNKIIEEQLNRVTK
jgi:hypothetical protein